MPCSPRIVIRVFGPTEIPIDDVPEAVFVSWKLVREVADDMSGVVGGERCVSGLY